MNSVKNEKTSREEIQYDDSGVRYFLLASAGWAGIAFLVGIVVALQLTYWKFNFDTSWLTFGRLRPLHTNAAIFAFAGNAIFAGIYYSLQRLLKTRLASDLLTRLHFWLWQLIIVSAAITLPLGYSAGKEYAELEWPIDIAITVVWVIFAVNFFWTIARRREKHLYVAIWFYIATVITVAVLHIVNSIEIPVAAFQSYPVWSGIQDALVQWWYGHNTVAFFLTTPFLGLMYYYLPKAANRPVYSYRLSVIHFWSLVFIYIWAGPHHLLNTALPDWAQNLGMVFSVMLWAPSWGGMINGLLTLRGAWHLLRTDPIIKFYVGAITFYGMATFEGPLLSIKSVNMVAHYTDWIVGHVHAGALGWNGFMAFALFYYLIPKLWNTKLHSVKLANLHFWIGLISVVLYYTSMVFAGITQGSMWMEVDLKGQLVYPDFIETVVRIIPLYAIRALAGILFLVGYLVMMYNLIKTIQSAKGVPEDEKALVPSRNLVFSKANDNAGHGSGHSEGGHRSLEGMGTAFSILTFLAILVGSVIEIYPTLSLQKYLEPNSKILPYTALEIAGRDIYVREGCYTCHSQMIRQLDFDVLRYGKASTVDESQYDRPFQWGSKRIGPDLARIGKKYPDLWHYQHMMDPRAITHKSIMPSYPWLSQSKVDFLGLRKRLSVLKYLGTPYTEIEVSQADMMAEAQAKEIASEIQKQGGPKDLEKTEMVALIAYLQALGQKEAKNVTTSKNVH